MIIEKDKICAVIVTFNPNIDVLNKLCFNLIKQVTDIIIVDNNSDDVIFLDLLMKDDSIEIIRLSDNFGISYAQNVGIKFSISKKSAYTVIFDQDSDVDKSLIEILYSDYKKVLKFSNIGIIGPSFFDSRDNSEYPACIINGFSLNKVYPSQSNEVIEVSFIISSGSLINNKVFIDVGYMMDDLFIDFVDIEWCLRAKSKGYKVYITPNARMHHTIGDSRMKVLNKDFCIHSPLRRYYIARNSILIFNFKYIDSRFRYRTAIYGTLRNIWHSLFFKNRKENIKMTLLGIYHGMINKKGKINFN